MKVNNKKSIRININALTDAETPMLKAGRIEAWRGDSKVCLVWCLGVDCRLSTVEVWELGSV